MLLNFPILSNCLFKGVCTERINVPFVTRRLTVLIERSHLAKRIKFAQVNRVVETDLKLWLFATFLDRLSCFGQRRTFDSD